ncbi:hypothetical protein [Azospirillum sp. B2RO_4]|uniref:hypothetical protein n=1 Tax=Azospirillum sp. B2RO_4 TaxID=3027796 RepID=UPI003DA8E3AB
MTELKVAPTLIWVTNRAEMTAQDACGNPRTVISAEEPTAARKRDGDGMLRQHHTGRSVLPPAQSPPELLTMVQYGVHEHAVGSILGITPELVAEEARARL